MFGKPPNLVCNNPEILSILQKVAPKFLKLKSPIIAYIGADIAKCDEYIMSHLNAKDLEAFKEKLYSPHSIDALAMASGPSYMKTNLLLINEKEWLDVFHTEDEKVGCIAHELAHLELRVNTNIKIRISRELSEKVEASKSGTRYFHSVQLDGRLTSNEYVTDALAIGRGFGHELSDSFKALLNDKRNTVRCGIPCEEIDKYTDSNDKVAYKIARKNETLHVTGFIRQISMTGLYFGDIKDNIYDGSCLYSLKESEGAVFVGTVNGMLQTRHGVLNHVDHYLYHGDFLRTVRDGEGRCYYANGETYVGSWKDDLYNGYGILYAPDGSVAQAGTWEAGLLITPETGVYTAFGVIEEVDGKSYFGDLKDGKYHGKGKYKSSGGFQVGEFLDGQLVEGVVFFSQDRAYYIGKFKDKSPHGRGRIYNEDDSVYDGEFVKGQYHGRGVMYNADDSIERGIWENGELVSPDQTQKTP
jgi:hypothetical protein